MLSAAHPKATEHQADACRDQYRFERLIPDELLEGALYLVHFLSPLFVVIRGILAHLSELLLGSIPCDAAQFLKIFSHFPRLFAKPITRGPVSPRAIGRGVSIVMARSIDGRHPISFHKNEYNLVSRPLFIISLHLIGLGDQMRPMRSSITPTISPCLIPFNRFPFNRFQRFVTKKADVVEHLEVFDHAGLLFNEPVAAATCPSFSHPTTSIHILNGAR
jgi:hypothetical protein